jgi:arylsulfatase A-like enzyme
MKTTSLAPAVLLVVVGLVAAALRAGAAEEAARPNILFLFGDDWAWPHASCLAAPQVKTPTFDRLAREGVLFRNAHCAAPSCSPSRAAILTGQWHWRLEQGANLRGFIAPRFEVYPDLLERAGYHAGFAGKGYGPGSLGGRPRNPAGQNYKSFAAFLAARPKGKPFCFWFGSTHPHRAYKWESGVQSGMDPAKVVVPPYLPDCETVRKDICDYYFEVQVFDTQAGELVAALTESGELDNTLIVMSGDNGWPFPRCKANLYESGTHQPLAVRWGAKVKGGRTVDDFTSLADLAPTFLDAAGLPVPKSMTARSLLPVLLSEKSGQVDAGRDHVLTGMETHVRCRDLGDGTLGGYPMRSIITKDFHFIRNFKPERWAAGDPQGCEVPGAEPFTYQQLTTNTRAALADCDASPSKAWMVLHRGDPAVKPLSQRAFGKRPERELYDLRKDPYELKNVADAPAYAEIVRQLEERLAAELTATGDPRIAGKGDELEKYARESPPAAKKPRAKAPR